MPLSLFSAYVMQPDFDLGPPRTNATAAAGEINGMQEADKDCGGGGRQAGFQVCPHYG